MSESEQLERAIKEAQRFIAAAKEARGDIKNGVWTSKRRAAAKRASMDLTRALAEFRGRAS